VLISVSWAFSQEMQRGAEGKRGADPWKVSVRLLIIYVQQHKNRHFPLPQWVPERRPKFKHYVKTWHQLKLELDTNELCQKFRHIGILLCIQVVLVTVKFIFKRVWGFLSYPHSFVLTWQETDDNWIEYSLLAYPNIIIYLYITTYWWKACLGVRICYSELSPLLYHKNNVVSPQTNNICASTIKPDIERTHTLWTTIFLLFF